MSNSISNDFDSQQLNVADRLLASPPVTHHAGQFDSVGDPAPVILAIQLDCQLHPLIIPTLPNQLRQVIHITPWHRLHNRPDPNGPSLRMNHVLVEPAQSSAARSVSHDRVHSFIGANCLIGKLGYTAIAFASPIARNVTGFGGSSMRIIIGLVPLLLTLQSCGGMQSRESTHGDKSGNEISKSYEEARKRESAKLTDADLKRMVDRLFNEPDPGRTNFHGLLWAGKRPVPFLVQVLDEPRTWSTVFFRQGFHLDGNSPFERICELLTDPAPPEAVKPLVKFLTHPDPAFRRDAARTLAHISTPDCIEPVKEALADPDKQVRAHTLIGIRHAVLLEPRHGEFLRAIFPSVLRMLDQGTYDLDGPAGVLAAIAPAEAAPILESPRYFNTRNPQILEVLRALNQSRAKVPAAILRPFIDELERDPKRAGQLAEALLLYALNPDAGAEARFRAHLYSAESLVSDAAAGGLEVLGGIDPHEVVSSLYRERGFNKMSKPQQYFEAIEDYKEEVDNGGHDQYFRNSTGDQYGIALEGLRAIGAGSKVDILVRAIGAFASATPSALNQDRRVEMNEFSDRQDAILRAADQKFYNSEKQPQERLEVLLMLYALNHKADFAPAPVPVGPKSQ